jgi:hypothetical protein
MNFNFPHQHRVSPTLMITIKCELLPAIHYARSSPLKRFELRKLIFLSCLLIELSSNGSLMTCIEFESLNNNSWNFIQSVIRMIDICSTGAVLSFVFAFPTENFLSFDDDKLISRADDDENFFETVPNSRRFDSSEIPVEISLLAVSHISIRKS